MLPFVPRRTRGAVAQLGERLNGIQEVDGSIPFSSTTLDRFAGAGSAMSRRVLSARYLAVAADGAPGFATLTGGNLGPISYLARTCVPVQPGVVYSFGGDVRFRSSQSSTVFLVMTFFSDAGCVTALRSVPLARWTSRARGRRRPGWRALAPARTAVKRNRTRRRLPLFTLSEKRDVTWRHSPLRASS